MRPMHMRFVAAVLVCSAFLAAPSAFAHARPRVMVPAADSTGPAPSSITVTFSEPVEPKFSSIALLTEEGKPINTAPSAASPNDSKTLSLAVPALQAGGYLVHWVSVAPDGHRMEGEYKFTVK